MTNQTERWRCELGSWFGDGKHPPTEVFQMASSFLIRARAANVPAPVDATVDEEGEIAFRWEKDGRLASACFLPSGDLVAYANRPEHSETFKLDACFDDNLDLSELFESLRSFRESET